MLEVHSKKTQNNPVNEWNPHLEFIDNIDSLQPNVSHSNLDFAGVINLSKTLS